MEVTEWCGYCDWDNHLDWDVGKEGYVAFCPHCGKEMLLCDECQNAEDNPDHLCNADICDRRRATDWRIDHADACQGYSYGPFDKGWCVYREKGGKRRVVAAFKMKVEARAEISRRLSKEAK